MKGTHHTARYRKAVRASGENSAVSEDFRIRQNTTTVAVRSKDRDCGRVCGERASKAVVSSKRFNILVSCFVDPPFCCASKSCWQHWKAGPSIEEQLALDDGEARAAPDGSAEVVLDGPFRAR